MAATKAFEKLTGEVNAYLREQEGSSHKPLGVAEAAMGFVRVANEAMCRPIRALTQVCTVVQGLKLDCLADMATNYLI